MKRPLTYCPLCGIILQYVPRLYSIGSRNQASWLAEVRGIVVDWWSSASLAGVGILCSTNTLSVPLDSLQTYRDSENCRKITLYQPQEREWGYGFHESCWSLLNARLSVPLPENERIIVKAVSAFLHAAPCPFYSSFSFGHDYGGATEMQEEFGPQVPIDPIYFSCDPMAIPSLDTIQSRAPNDWTFPSIFLPTDHTLTTSFSWAFPLEITHEILCYLALHDISALRLTCRKLAVTIQWGYLPQSFWRSRFMLGNEADFLFISPGSGRDWLQLFLGLRKSLQPGEDPYLINRKRIRKCCEHIAVHVECALKSPEEQKLNGLSVFSTAARGKPHFFSLDQDTNGPRDSLAVTSSFYCRPNKRQICDARSVLEYRALTIPDQVYLYGAKIGISTVIISGESHISGISFSSANGSQNLFSIIGYHSESRQQYMDLAPKTKLEQLEIAFRSTGLIGIKLPSLASNNASQWLGQVDGDDIAFGILELPTNERQTYIIAGMDAVKIVHLGSAQLNKEAGDSNSTPPGPNPNSPLSYLWTPRLFSNSNVTISPMHSPWAYYAFALMDVDFGGQNGELLSSLTKIDVQICPSFHKIIGLQFNYIKGMKAFGMSDGVRLSLLIDGPGGERITGTELVAYEHHGVVGMVLSTNFGRSIFLGPFIHSASSDVKKTGLSIPENSTITGFSVARFSLNEFVSLVDYESFSGVALQSQTLEHIPLHFSSKDACPPSFREDEEEYDKHLISLVKPYEGYSACRTCETLKHVRRIEISTGAMGTSRSSCRISGLKLDYFNQRSSVTLGQWADKFDYIDLSPDETIRAFTIWISIDERGPLGRTGLRLGQVAAILISTNKKAKMFFPSESEMSLRQCYQMQYGSQRDQELVGISWVFNSSYDRVRGIMSPKSLGSMPDLKEFAKERIPFDCVLKLPFQRISNCGEIDDVVTIKAYFEEDIITGLEFIYKSNENETVGSVLTTDVLTSQLPDGGRVECLEVVTASFAVISFQLEFMMADSSTQCILFSKKSDVSRFHWLRTYAAHKEEWVNRVEYQSGSRVDIVPADAQLAGVHINCQDFSKWGALYTHI